MECVLSNNILQEKGSKYGRLIYSKNDTHKLLKSNGLNIARCDALEPSSPVACHLKDNGDCGRVL